MLFAFKKGGVFIALIIFILIGHFFITQEVYAQQANFGYAVNEYNVEVEVLSPIEGNYYYGWSVEDPCEANESECYDLYGQSISRTINMLNYEGSDNLSPELYLEVADENGDIIASDSKTISVGNGVSYSDSDGDGTQDSSDQCPNDPQNNCEDSDEEEGNNENNNNDGGDGGTAGLVNCGNPGADGELQESEMCDYQALISMINSIIAWLIGILVVVATLLFMYAGILYLTAGSDSEQVDTAKEIFQNVAGGFLIVLLAFTLIATLVNILTREDWRDNWNQAIPIELSLHDDSHNFLS